MSESVGNFLKIRTREALCAFLGIGQSELEYLCPFWPPRNRYRTFYIRKKSGGVRRIAAPNRQLKYIQRTLARVLGEIYRPKQTVHGYVRGRSILTGAQVHVGSRHVLCLDISDFFPSIHFGRVLGMFRSEPFRFPREIAVLLTRLVCHEGSLPQGAPTSPVISNFICRAMDSDLKKFCAKYRVVCTRYCDDVTISTRAVHFPEAVVLPDGTPGAELAAIFERHSFHLNAAKTRLRSYGARKTVTGLVVNEKLNLPKEAYRAFRAQLHYTYCNGLREGAARNGFLGPDGPDGPAFGRYLTGKVNYFRMVLGEHSSKYRYLAERANAIFGEERFRIPEPFESDLLRYVFVIEWGMEAQGTAFLLKGVGLVTCLHNVWPLAVPVDMGALEARLAREVKVYLPPNDRRTYPIALKEVRQEEDLLVLATPFPSDCGLERKERAAEHIREGTFFSVGYPKYAPGKTMDRLDGIRVRYESRSNAQKLFVVDKQFLTGASGGPVFDEQRRVVGMIDRGDESSGQAELESAFCLLTF